MRIAMSLNICLGRWPETKLIPLVAEAGFDGLDFNFGDVWHDT